MRLLTYSPDLGLVPNERFIGIAEQTGLIAPIGEWVLRRACGQAKAWIDSGAPITRVSVNVSAQQFRGQDLPRVIRSALDETGLGPEALEIELTESTLMQDPEGAAQTLRDISSLGVSISTTTSVPAIHRSPTSSVSTSTSSRSITPLSATLPKIRTLPLS